MFRLLACIVAGAARSAVSTVPRVTLRIEETSKFAPRGRNTVVHTIPAEDIDESMIPHGDERLRISSGSRVAGAAPTSAGARSGGGGGYLPNFCYWCVADRKAGRGGRAATRRSTSSSFCRGPENAQEAEMNLSLSRPAAAVVVGAEEEGDTSDHEPEPDEDPLRQQSFAAAPRRRPPPGAPPGGVQEEDPRERPRERASEEQLELAGEGVASWLKFYVFSSVQTLSKFGKGVWAAVSELGDDFVGEVACSRSRNTARSRREKAALIACLQELHKEEAREQQLQQQQAQAEQAAQPQQEHQEGKQDLQTVERCAIDQFSQAVKMGAPSSGSCSSASGGSCRSAEGPHMISALPSAPAFSRVSSTETSGTCTDVDGEARSTVTLEELHLAVRESRLQAAKIVVSPVALHTLGTYLLSEEDQAKMYHWALLLRFRRQLRGPQRDGPRAQEMSASSSCCAHEEEAPEDRERGKGRRDLFPLQEAAGAARHQQMEEEDEQEEEELEGRWGSKASSSMSPPQETSETTPERSPESGSDSATSGADTWLNLESTAGARPFRTVLKKKPQRPRSNSVLSSASTMAPSSDSDAGQSRRSSTVGLASAADSDNEDSKILAEQLSALSLCSETRSPAFAPAGAPAPVVRPPPPPDPSVGEQFLHSVRLQLADLRAPSIPENRTLDGCDEDGNKQQTSACSDHDQMEMDMDQQSCSTSSEEVEELDGDFLEEEFSLRIERLNTGEVTVRRSPSFISDPGRESEESRRSGGDFVEGTLLLPEECKPVEWRHENSTPRGRVVVSPPVAKELSLKKKEAKGNGILRRGAGAGSACASAGFAEKISAKVDQEQEEQALGAKIPWDKFFRWFFQEAMIAGWFCEPGAKRCKIAGPLPPHYHLAHNNCQHLVYRFFRDVLELQQTPKFFSSTVCRTSPLEGWRAAEGGSSGITDETDAVETCSRSSKSAVLEEVGEAVEGTGSRSAVLAAPGLFEENSTSASMKTSGSRRISSGTASANRSSSADPGLGLATLLCAGTRARKRDKRSVAMGGGTITNQERRGCTLMKNGLVAPAPICRPTPPKLKVKRTDFHSRAAGRAFLTPLVTPSLLAEGQASETPGIRSTRRRKRKHFLKVAPHNSQIAVVQRNRNENGRRRFQLQEGQEHQLQQDAETKSKSKGGETSQMTTTSESSDATASRKTSSSTRAAKKIQCEPWLRATSPLACRILGTSVPDADADPERRRCNDNFAEFQRFVYGASQDQRDPPLFPCCGHGRKEMLQTEDGGRLLV